MKQACITIAILIMGFTLNAQDAREISKKSSNAISLDAMEMVSTLKIISANGDERVRTMSTATKKFGEVSKMMMKFLPLKNLNHTIIKFIL